MGFTDSRGTSLLSEGVSGLNSISFVTLPQQLKLDKALWVSLERFASELGSPGIACFSSRILELLQVEEPDGVNLKPEGGGGFQPGPSYMVQSTRVTQDHLKLMQWVFGDLLLILSYHHSHNCMYQNSEIDPLNHLEHITNWDLRRKWSILVEFKKAPCSPRTWIE